MTDRTSLGHWIRRFLLEYTASERNLSANTCASYRDMLVLLLPYAAKRKGVAADTLSVTDLSAELVRSFLVYLEQERQCCTATRNQRLASIHALARFIGEHSPQHVEWCAQVRMVPMKKGASTSLTYLESRKWMLCSLPPTNRQRKDGATTRCCCSFTTPVLASAKQRPFGSATSIGTPSPLGSRAKGTSSAAARSGP
jgi:hypothetical protein